MRMFAGIIRGLPILCLVISIHVALAASVSDAQAGSFREGVAAYKAAEYTEAHRIWSRLARTGYVLAQYNLAIMYFAGRGLDQDYAQAMEWFQRAASNNFAPALVNLAHMFRDGLGTGKNPENALAHLIAAIDALPPGTCRELAVEEREAISDFLSESELRRAEEIATETLHSAGSSLSIYSYAGNCFDSIALGGGTIQTVAQAPEFHPRVEKMPDLNMPDRVVASDTLKRRKTEKRTARIPGTVRRGAYHVQVGAMPTHAAARRFQAAVRKRHTGLIGEHKVFIREAQVPVVGTVFRVRIGPFREKVAADGVCRALREKQQACFVIQRSATSAASQLQS